jgi:protein involved in plasmid replication-relaxation
VVTDATGNIVAAAARGLVASSGARAGLRIRHRISLRLMTWRPPRSQPCWPQRLSGGPGRRDWRPCSTSRPRRRRSSLWGWDGILDRRTAPAAGAGGTAEPTLVPAGGGGGDPARRRCQLLSEHRVLTTGQLTQLAFPSADAAEHRLVILWRLRLVDRFRPRHTPGSAPYHYVLGPLGAALLAAQADQDPSPAAVGYRRDRTLALAHSQRLAHLVGVNGFFCALAHHARHHPETELERWWPEQRCAAHWGRLVRPDGYGRWREHSRRVDFFLEYDRGTQAPHRLAGKLGGYLDLTRATGIRTPLLLWLPTPAREDSVRRALAGTSLPIATATPNPGHSPAGPIWLLLHADGPRRRLIDLPGAWRPPP